MKKFKVGDNVYFPRQTTKVCTLVEFDSISYPLSIALNSSSRLEICTTSGEVYEGAGIPCILHATPENKELLEKLYGVEFEARKIYVDINIAKPFKPKIGEVYWVLEPYSDIGYTDSVNENKRSDNKAIENGVWKTEEDIILVLNSIKQSID